MANFQILKNRTVTNDEELSKKNALHCYVDNKVYDEFDEKSLIVAIYHLAPH